MTRILIAYATTDGHTARIARYVAETLREARVTVDLVDLGARIADPDPAVYDQVVVAASVHQGGYQRAMRQWAAKHAAQLNGMPAVFVSVCLGVLEHSPKTDAALAGIIRKMTEETGWTRGRTKIVAGALLYRQYNWIKRWMMRRIVAKAKGDVDTSRNYDYTDWTDLHRFTLGLLDHQVERKRA